MDMYKKRKQRKEKREQNIEESKGCASTNINWEICIYANTPSNLYK